MELNLIEKAFNLQGEVDAYYPMIKVFSDVLEVGRMFVLSQDMMNLHDEALYNNDYAVQHAQLVSNTVNRNGDETRAAIKRLERTVEEYFHAHQASEYEKMAEDGKDLQVFPCKSIEDCEDYLALGAENRDAASVSFAAHPDVRSRVKQIRRLQLRGREINFPAKVIIDFLLDDEGRKSIREEGTNKCRYLNKI